MSNLTTVPMFVFYQGDPWAEDHPSEYPIEVKYYNGCISIEQNGNTISVLPEYFEKLIREIRKHRPEAEAKLNR